MDTIALVIQLILLCLMIFLFYKKKLILATASMLCSIAIVVYLNNLYRHEPDANVIVAAICFWGYVILLLILLVKKLFSGMFANSFPQGLVWIFLGIFLIIFFLPIFAIVPLGIMLIASIIYGIYTYRRAVLSDVLSTVCSCIEQNMPLSTGLAQAAKNNTGGAVRVLNMMSGWLSKGCTLSEAMSKSYSGFPGHVTSLIEMAEKAGQLPQAARYIKQRIYETDNNSWSSRMGYSIFAYPFAIMMIATSITFGICTFVIPKFKTIFADMGSELPPATRFLLEFIDNFLMNPFSALFFTTLPFAILFFYIRRMFFERKPDNPKPLDDLGDTIKWSIPGFHWFEKITSHIRVIEYLRLAIASGVSLDIAINNCARLDVNRRFRHKLKKWYLLVESGTSVSKAARKVNLMRSLVWCFDSDYGPSNVPEALEMLEKHLNSYLQFRCNVIKEYIGPVIIILSSLIVGFLVYSMFVPMVQMIWDVLATV